MDVGDVVIVGGVIVAGILLLRKNGTAVAGSDDVAGAVPAGDGGKTLLGVGGDDVGSIFKAVSGIPIIGAIAKKQWDISPSSVVGGIVMGPVGAIAGAVRDLVPNQYNPFHGGKNPSRRLTTTQITKYRAMGYSVTLTQSPKGIKMYTVLDAQGKVVY